MTSLVWLCGALWLMPTWPHSTLLWAQSGSDAPGDAAPPVTTQPARLEPYEQTPLYAKAQGYVRSARMWSDAQGQRGERPIADIGDEVAQGEVLAELDIPEMLEEFRQKEALAEQAAAELLQASAAVAVAERAMQAGQARIAESQAGVVRARGELDRWQAEFERISDLARRGSVTSKLVDETQNQLRAAEAGRDEAEAHVTAVEADLAEAEAHVAKARADEAVARVRVRVAEAEVARVQALLGYSRVLAPFAGIVTQRNIDTGHLVQPGSGTALPLYVVERIDVLRVVADVPERDAPLVHTGHAAWILIPALSGQELTATVSRTSWVLDPASRTLRVEIDLPNPDKRFRPGMYAKVRIELKDPQGQPIPSTP
jgi:multidrug efflux pump subunit AcrA (membrane-fusion protein)